MDSSQTGNHRSWQSTSYKKSRCLPLARRVTSPIARMFRSVSFASLLLTATAALRVLAQIVSFDLGGISGHPNHIATARGVHAFAADPRWSHLDVYELLTVSIVQKFTGVLAVLPFAALTWLAHCGVNVSVVTTSVNPGVNWRAMAAHASQFIWFRRLFLAFSCYTYINCLRQVDIACADVGKCD